MDKAKVKSNILTLSIIGIPIGLLLMSVGVINDGGLVNLTKDMVSDVGMTFLGLCFLTFLVILIFFTPNLDGTPDKATNKLLGIGICFVFLLMTVYGGINTYNAILDYQTEPKEVYLEDCDVYCVDAGQKSSAHYYIVGNSKNGKTEYEIPRDTFVQLKELDSFEMELLVYENTEVIPSIKIINRI